METKYTKEYFIAKFEAIPDELWIRGNIGEGTKHCAIGHCGVSSKDNYKSTKESIGLCKLLNLTELEIAIQINDRCDDKKSPKERVLSALKAL